MNINSIGWVVRLRYIFNNLYKRHEKYILLMRLDKPIGILLLLWPTLWALWLAYDGNVPPGIVIVFILGVILTRSAGCAINDFADRKLDARVKRTEGRPVASGMLKPGEAVAVFVILSLIAFSLVLIFLNLLCLYLSLIAAALIYIYPFTKRVTHLPQAVLGAAFAMSVLMAYAMADPVTFASPTNADDPDAGWFLEPFILYLGVIFWAVAYDTMYAMVDKDDDVKVGIKSTAILFADMYIIILGILQILVILSLVFIGDDKALGKPFYISLGIAALLFGYQLFLSNGRDRDGCFRAFLNNGWVGFIIFLGIFFSYHIMLDGYSVMFYVYATWVLSIVIVYFIAIIRQANRKLWVTLACVLGPVAIIPALASKRVAPLRV